MTDERLDRTYQRRWQRLHEKHEEHPRYGERMAKIPENLKEAIKIRRDGELLPLLGSEERAFEHALEVFGEDIPWQGVSFDEYEAATIALLGQAEVPLDLWYELRGETPAEPDEDSPE